MSEVKWCKARKKPIIVEYREVIPSLIEVSNHPYFGSMQKDLRNPSSYRESIEVYTIGSKHIAIREGWRTIKEFEVIQTGEGELRGYLDEDYIIKGIRGELYPIKKDIFNETYDVINDE